MVFVIICRMKCSSEDYLLDLKILIILNHSAELEMSGSTYHSSGMITGGVGGS